MKVIDCFAVINPRTQSIIGFRYDNLLYACIFKKEGEAYAARTNSKNEVVKARVQIEIQPERKKQKAPLRLRTPELSTARTAFLVTLLNAKPRNRK